MKLLTVLGARPQFIKAGAVSRAIRQFNSGRVIVDSRKVTVDSDSEGGMIKSLHGSGEL